MSDRVIAIINAAAGKGCTDLWAANLHARLCSGGKHAEVVMCQSGADIIAATQRAVAQRANTVVAGGGDGTISAVASVLIGTDIALALLPMGTLNHFAKDLHVPLDIEHAIDIILAGHSIQVDTGEVNGRSFINNSSLGIYPDIVRDREKQQRRLGRGKWTAFAGACLTALRRYPFLKVQLSLNNAQHFRQTPFVFIGNNEYQMSGFNIGDRKTLQDGCLSLYVAQKPGRLGLLRLALHALFGRLKQASDFDILLADQLIINTRRKRMRVALDGEVTILSPPLRYRVKPLSLRVIVPCEPAVT